MSGIVGGITGGIVGGITGGIMVGGGVTDPYASLDWSAGLSEYQRSGANASDDDFELKAQIDGVGAPAFVTPATLTLPDWEGVNRTADGADVAPVYGSRVVKQLLTYSNDITDAGTPWAFAGGAISLDHESFKKGPGATYARGMRIGNSGLIVGRQMIVRFKAKSPDAATALIPSNAFGVDAEFTLTTEWRDYAVAGTVVANDLRWYPDAGLDTESTFFIKDVMVEDATGRTDTTNPSAFIASTDVLPPVKHYANQNGNTVSGNVVTEAVGNPLLIMPSLFAAPAGTWDGIVVDSAITISYDIANHADNQGCYYCEYTPLGGITQDGIINLNEAVGRVMYHDNATRIQSYDGTALVDIISSFVADTTHKTGLAYGTAEASRELYKDGVSSSGDYDGTFQNVATAIRVLGSANGLGPRVNYPSLIRNIRRYDLPYTESKAKIAELML